MQPLLSSLDANGRQTAAILPSGHHMAVRLDAGTEKTVAVPAGASTVSIAATDDVWVGFGRPASVPAVDIIDGSAPELNPSVRALRGVASIGLAAPRACMVSLGFFR